MSTKFKKGVSGNPAGRPKGVKNQATIMRKQLADDLPNLLEVVKKQALGGDIQAAKIILDRVLPPLKSIAPAIHLPDLAEAQTLTDKAETIITAAGNGDLAPDLAAQLISAVATLAKVIEIDQLKERLEAIEQYLQERKREK